MVKLFEIDKQFAEMLREPQNFGRATPNTPAMAAAMWEAVRLPQRRHRQSTGPFNPGERGHRRQPLLAQAVATPMARRSAGELNCEGKMFWDQVHPTTVVHAALSERAAAFIEQEYEFLPDNGGHLPGPALRRPSLADKGK